MKVVKRNKSCIPTKIQKLEPQPTLSLIFHFKTDLFHYISILGSVLTEKGLKTVHKAHFFQIYLIHSKSGHQGTKQMSILGVVGVKKWSPFFAFGHDVGRSVLHRETFMIYAHSDANFAVQIRTHFPVIFSDWRSQNLPTFSSLQCMHISIGKVTHKRLEFWTS